MNQKVAGTCLPFVAPSTKAIKWFVGMAFAVLSLQACTGANTFPTIARAGDTISVMVGGSEEARKETVAVTLQDSNGQSWDLQAQGLVRSVFNLRPDGRSFGLHYSKFIDSDISWLFGHEPMQTVLVTDLPAATAPGMASLTISLNATDNSSGIADPFTVPLEIISGSGSPDQFLWRDSLANISKPALFGKLEPTAHAKINFSNSGAGIGAASLEISFDSTALNGGNINLYVPESTVRGDAFNPGAFGETQRMVYWYQDGQNLYIDIIAPQGIAGKYLQLYVLNARNVTPNYMLTSATLYDINGNVLSVQPPVLEYFP